MSDKDRPQVINLPMPTDLQLIEAYADLEQKFPDQKFILVRWPNGRPDATQGWNETQQWETKTVREGVHEPGWEPIGGSAYTAISRDCGENSESIEPLVVLRRRIK